MGKVTLETQSRFFRPARSAPAAPLSPFSLVQEFYAPDPYKVLIATVFLSRTQGHVALPRLPDFLSSFPTPASALSSDLATISSHFLGLGLHNQRAKRVLEIARRCDRMDFDSASEIDGVGQYGDDSFRIFCKGLWREKDVRPKDGKLKMYIKWRRQVERENGRDVTPEPDE